jgi:hypothetical protein
MTYQIDYAKFDAEVKAIRSDIKEFKEGRKRFDAKIAQIIKGGTTYPDKQYPPSSYGTDMQQCLDGLAKLSVDPERARQECETQFAGKGTKIGVKQYSNLELLSMKQRRDLEAAKGANQCTKGASVQQQSLDWLVTYEYARGPLTPTLSDVREEPIKSASAVESNVQTEEPYFVTLMNHSPIERSQDVARTESKLKQASITTNTEQEPPAWATCYNYIINKD